MATCVYDGKCFRSIATGEHKVVADGCESINPDLDVLFQPSQYLVIMKTVFRTSAPALFVLLSIVFASDLIVTKVGLAGTAPLVFAGSRYLLAGSALLLAAAAFRRIRSVGMRDIVRAILLGGLASVEFGSLYVGMQYISAGATSILYYTQPVMVAVLATAFLRETLSWRRIFAVLFGFVGALLIFAENLGSGPFSFGGLLVLLSAFSWALATIAFKKFAVGENYLLVASTLLMSAGIFLLLFSTFFGEALVVFPSFVLALIYLAFVGSAFGVALWAYLLGRFEAGEVSTWFFLVPVFSVFLGWTLLGEKVFLTEIVGIFCVGLSIII